jgi:seryl-tRNA synthetase
MRADLNALKKEIGALMKNKADASALLAKKTEMENSMVETEARAKALHEQVQDKLRLIGNLVPDSVPVSDNEDNNLVVRKFGEPIDAAASPFPFLNHVNLMERLEWIDTEAGSKIAGGRGYFLKNECVLLNQALINYAMGFLVKRGYCPIQTPFFMEKAMMMECAQLSQFDEELYHVSAKSRAGGEESSTDKYLIATSEQPISCYHFGETLHEDSLPLKYAGYSTCFRKEAGSGGRDTKGIFRIHQFEKVEQFVICSPEDNTSWKLHEEMIQASCDFYESLNIPYHVINIVSGALNDAAAKKYDLEAWFPASKTYRELVSCSNCLDFQSRRVGTKFTGKGAANERGETRFVHMLNATLSATERAMCCIVENYQDKDGVRIPDVLQPYMHGITRVNFRKELQPEKEKVAAKK